MIFILILSKGHNSAKHLDGVMILSLGKLSSDT